MVYAYSPAMADESKTPEEHISEALDLMVQAGWIIHYAKDPRNMTIRWSEKGAQTMAGIFMSIQELDPEKLNQELWWAVGSIANLRFGPGGQGFSDAGIGE